MFGHGADQPLVHLSSGKIENDVILRFAKSPVLN